MVCRVCGSQNVFIQAVTDVQTKRTGCLGWLFWLILACFTFGLILIIPLIRSVTKSKTHTEAVCQNCGNRWRV